MADLIPSLNSCLSRMQAGEKRFARRLATHLEDDYLCWYETGVGLRPRYTDFAILHPLRGLLLLEVKDWREETIRSANPDSFELLTSSGLKNVQNPLKQARLCMYKLKEQLERDPQLVSHTGTHAGKLIFPYAFGVVFTNLTRAQFEKAGLENVIPAVQSICKDEMTATCDVENFQKRLWDMFPYCFRDALTQPQIDRIRWHMFPEVRMQPQPELDLAGGKSVHLVHRVKVPDIIKVMDLKQEKLARGLGAGHRVIHGVAGSGKTMILGYRCLELARQLHKPILVLCYNVVLAARLRSLMHEHGLDGQINVYNIHHWATTVLKTYNFKPPAIVDNDFDATIEFLISKVASGQIPRGQYGAILVDEGHDFRQEWLRLIVDMLDPATDSLLLLYDDTQSIYKRSSGLGFSLKDVGIEAQGRTTILKLNYRNTEEILKFAFDFVGDYVHPNNSDVPIVEPDTAGRAGSMPAVKSFDSFEGEARYIATTLGNLHIQRGVKWADMCVLYCHGWMGKAITDALDAGNIPYAWLRDSRSKRLFDSAADSVKVITMHSSKGLEFPTVAACGIGSMGLDEERLEEEAKLLYVAMTRATQNLLLTGSKPSPFAVRLTELLEKHRHSATV